MAGWIKIPHGREIGLDSSNIVLDGDQAPLPQKGGRAPNFRSISIVPNGWMDQDATRYGGRTRPRPHSIRWNPAPTLPQKRGGCAQQPPQFSAHVCCGQTQTAGWIEILLGTEVGLGSDHVLCEMGTQLPHLKRATVPPLFLPTFIVDQDASWHEGMPWPRPHCVTWGSSFPQKGHSPQLSAHVYCGQRVAHLSYC